MNLAHTLPSIHPSIHPSIFLFKKFPFIFKKKTSYGMKNDRIETLRHIEYLIAHGDLNEAHMVWNDRLREEGLSIPSDGDLITNAGFKKEGAVA